MSIKTLRKRIALVAVSALGVGLLSVAPASADVDSNSVSLGSASTGVCASDNATGTLTSIAIAKTGTLLLSVNTDSDAADTLSLTGVAFVDSFTVLPASALSANQKKITADTDDEAYVATVKFTGSGAATAFTQVNGSGATQQTISITVVESCAGVNVINGANSFVQVIDTADRIQREADLGTTSLTTITESGSTRTYTQGSSLVMNTSVDQKTSFANGDTAHVSLMGRDAYKNIAIGADYIYQLSCTGDVSVNGGTSSSGFIAGVASQYIAQFTVAQGTANVPVTTTCTASISGVTVGTKSIVFAGDLAKIEASLRTVGASGTAAGDATAGTISYKYFDAAGNRLATTGTGLGNPELTATGSPLINAISSVTATTATTTGRLSYNCVGATKSGDVSLVIKRTNAAGATISAPAFTASCGGSLDTYTASLDKASYNVGDIATLTIKGLDANGKKVNDAVTAGTGAAITVSGMTAVTAPSTADLFVNGELVYTYKVDNTAGNYVASVYLPSAGTQTTAVTQKVAITAQAGVTNTEVLAAIVKLIASINKQIRALQKSLRR